MRLAILFLILIFLADMLGFYISAYRIPIYDTVLHFFGGFFVAMFFYIYLKDSIRARCLKNALIIVGVTVFIGAIWEFAEYSATSLIGDYLYDKYRIICCIGDMNDTLNDLAMDIIGAITFALVFLNPLRRFNSKKI